MIGTMAEIKDRTMENATHRNGMRGILIFSAGSLAGHCSSQSTPLRHGAV
jgi:hypothetical protein